MAVRDGSNLVDKYKTVGVLSVFALAVGVGLSKGLPAQGAESARPSISQRSGNTWCGVVTTAGGGDLMSFSRELATYVDAGASIEGYVKDSKADHTALVCGSVSRTTLK